MNVIESTNFQWQEGIRAAISLSFDDARVTQVDAGLPVLDRFGVKATFYLSPQNIGQRQDAWRNAAAHGHEMGNHTMTHPCTGNFVWSRQNALEDKTVDDIDNEIAQASEAIAEMVGVKTRTFAYPCGQRFIGRGEQQQSYVPVIARRFLAGRGFRDETINNPAFCDLAQVMGVDSDDQPFEKLKGWIDRAVNENGWLVLCSHDIGVYPRQAMTVRTLESLCQYCCQTDNGLWISTVANVAGYIQQQRSNT